MISARTSLLLFATIVGSLAACTPRPGDDCKEFSRCSPPGDGDGDGDTGGNPGDGDGDGDTGGGANTACDPACEGDTPVCNGEQECVECTEEDSSACTGETLLCDAQIESCVECLDSDDCGESFPICDGGSCSGCESNLDCERFSSTPVCENDSGGCVECMDADDCGGKVCDPDTNTCTTLDAGTLGACDECQYDAQCATGRVCVEMSYTDPMTGVIGNFCLWERDATGIGAPDGACGLNSRPFAQQATVISVNGTEPVVVCQLRTTTCPGLKDHAVDVDECQIAGDDDDACGAPDFNDGLCRGGGSTLCTYPCAGSDDRDCPVGISCIDDMGDKYCGI